MKVLFAAIISVIILFVIIFFKDVLKNKEKMSSENGSALYYIIAEFIVWFAATLGISSSALNTIALRHKAYVPLDILPRNICCRLYSPYFHNRPWLYEHISRK